MTPKDKVMSVHPSVAKTLVGEVIKEIKVVQTHDDGYNLVNDVWQITFESGKKLAPMVSENKEGDDYYLEFVLTIPG